MLFADNCYLFFYPFSWHILMRMRAPKEGSCDPIPPLELPHSLHAFHRVSEADELNKVRHHTIHYFEILYYIWFTVQLYEFEGKDTFSFIFLFVLP